MRTGCFRYTIGTEAESVLHTYHCKGTTTKAIEYQLTPLGKSSVDTLFAQGEADGPLRRLCKAALTAATFAVKVSLKNGRSVKQPREAV
ncbi:hypothetical protein H2203_007307 [Taxawa tesnikishii (nom. ined.)]|nr:hypothetical protein H2203_007307 [Dothideales sp. JES 119]